MRHNLQLAALAGTVQLAKKSLTHTLPDLIMIQPVQLSVVVGLAVGRAFDRFALDLASWWPREYRWSQDVLQQIGIDPRAGGLCFEIGPNGFRCDWGRVLA